MDSLQDFLIFLLSENEKEICVTVELPGAEQKDLKLTIEKDLAIEGEKKEEGQKKKNFNTQNRQPSSFCSFLVDFSP